MKFTYADIKKSGQPLSDEQRYELLKEYKQRVGFKKDDPRWHRFINFSEKTGHFEDVIQAYKELDDKPKLVSMIYSMFGKKRPDLAGEAWNAVEKSASFNTLRGLGRLFYEHESWGDVLQVYSDMAMMDGYANLRRDEIGYFTEALDRLGYKKEAQSVRTEGLVAYTFGARDMDKTDSFIPAGEDLNRRFFRGTERMQRVAVC